MTEIYVDEVTDRDEIKEILKQGLKGFEIDPLCDFYMNIMKMLH